MACPTAIVTACTPNIVKYFEGRKYLSFAEHGNLEGVISTLRAGADPYFKIKSRFFEAVINLSTPINPRHGEFGQTAVQLAAEKGRRVIVQYLLENFPDIVKQTDKRDQTALFFAHETCIPLLIGKIDIKYKNKSNFNALFTQIVSVNQVGVSLILQHMKSLRPGRLVAVPLLNQLLPIDMARLIESYMGHEITKEDIIVPDSMKSAYDRHITNDKVNALFEHITLETGIGPHEWTILSIDHLGGWEFSWVAKFPNIGSLF